MLRNNSRGKVNYGSIGIKPMSIKTKISGITTREALNSCIKHRVDYVGMVFYDASPRNMSFNHAHEFAALIPPTIKKVAVVVNPDKYLIKEIERTLSPDYYQLDDNEPYEQAEYLKAKYKLNLIKTIYVGSKIDINLLKSYEPHVDGFLFESKANDEFYVNQAENVFDWGLLKNVSTLKLKILSGGLNKFNVANAIRVSGAGIINASSTLESSPGIKDIATLEEFLRLVKANGMSNGQ